MGVRGEDGTEKDEEAKMKSFDCDTPTRRMQAVSSHG